MKYFEYIKNFLYDQENFISIFEHHVIIYNFLCIVSINSNMVLLKLKDKSIKINGNDLKVLKMMGSEIELSGNIKNIEVSYE